MVEENKVRVYAPIDVQEGIEKLAWEKASSLAFPEEKQGDLQYIRSILVSAGTNKNGAHFLPSEMMLAQGTIVNKAIDIEHEESKVIGHIYDAAFLYKDGTQFDPLTTMAEFKEASQNPDTLDIDIAAVGVIHKMRFPELAEEISTGEWKVSMECFFKDFDIKIGDTIITKDEAQALGYNPDDLIGGFVKVIAGTKALGKSFVARVLRDITFSGMGIVKNPANPHSIIMETASRRELMERGEQVVDLEHIDNLRGHKIELSSQEEVRETAANESNDVEEGSLYFEIDTGTGDLKRILSVEGKENAAARWTGNGLGGPGNINSYPDEMCKSFKKRLTKFNALDQSEGVVIHEHWCALFEEACPVIGASAKAPECLRNAKNRTIKDDRDNTLTKTIREQVDDAPSNTFTTVLGRPTLVKAGVSAPKTVEEKNAQVTRIRVEAEELRNSLRAFVTSEKKTLA